jgi:ribA/ribD-fused uncharacterized protein
MQEWVIDQFKDEFAFLSNFFPSPLEYNEKILKLLNLNFKVEDFKTLEHAYQAAKTKNFKKFEEIRLAQTPGKSKRLGKQVQEKKVNLRLDWFKINVELMEELLRIKFSNSYFKDKLLQTGDAILKEGNYWHDNFFGDCFCERCKKRPGKNILGKLLMKIRKELQGEYILDNRMKPITSKKDFKND